MGKNLFIAEKPSVAREFANALKYNMRSKDGYLESEEAIVTWCVGHLVTMSYPEVYDEKFKRWSFETLPFLPAEFKYEVIESAKKQYTIVMVTHNMQQAARISDKTAFFLLGEMVEMNDTETIFSKPKDKRTDDYITGRFG